MKASGKRVRREAGTAARRGAAAALAGGVLAAAVCATPAMAATGRLAVKITAPKGVPANVVLSGGSDRVAAKPASGRKATVILSLGTRRYAVRARSFSFGGRSYVGTASTRAVRVKKGRTATVRVRFRGVPSASRLRATKLEASRLALSWRAPKGARFALRRAAGPHAPSTRAKGAAVKVKGRTALDTRLEPGKQYSYALFTRVRRRWTGPVTLTAGTLPPAGSANAAFIASPGALLAKAGDVASAAPTGTAVALRLARRIDPPLIGTVVVLPPSASLPGGFLGRVTAVAPTGTATLTAASLDDAFDFYSVDIPEFADAAAPLVPAQAARAPSRAGTRSVPGLKACLGGSGSQSITLKPSLGLGGHFKAQIDKFSIFGHQIPKGASLDMKFTVTAAAAVDAKVSASLKCQAPFDPVMKMLTTSPVPISFYFTPNVEASVNGSAEVSNVGVTATAGVQFAGSLGLGGASFHGGPIFTAGPTPAQGTIEGSIGATIGGEVIIGPGAGTPGAGVIAGVGGKLNPVDATIGPVFAANDSRHGACLKTEAAFTRELNLTAKAWLGSWDVSRSVTFDFLKGRTQYFGSPWHWPTDCTNLAPDQPGDTVPGAGVDVVEDSQTGSPDQWGHLDGFIPGTKSWVLSTGSIGDAVGTPDQFAGTDLGQPGDGDLSALAGHETFDAASYQATVIPHGDQLHVRYVFASEEYPEYVGSEFNDVMQVLVNGTNCALVPGTTSPVAVNTINATTNSDYFVDNQTGAAGYSTSMDGLTVPLTCNANVTPGQPVTVKIAVADSSDGDYDSAVALVDKGIWAD